MLLDGSVKHFTTMFCVAGVLCTAVHSPQYVRTADLCMYCLSDLQPLLCYMHTYLIGITKSDDATQSSVILLLFFRRVQVAVAAKSLLLHRLE